MSGIFSITGNSAPTGFYDHTIGQSLRFEDGDNPKLSRTPSSAGNQKTWTWSGWVKRGNLGSEQTFFMAYKGINDYVAMQFDSGDEFNITYKNVSQSGGSLSSQTRRKITTQKFRDVSAWYNIVVKFDAANTNCDIYINGSEVTDFSVNEEPQNLNFAVNEDEVHYIGASENSVTGVASTHFDGYLAEINLVDGTALDASSFGETKAGIWIPKKYTGSYGTNGFYLTFAEAGDLGADGAYTTHDIFGDSSAFATYLFDGSIVDAGGNYNGTATSVTFTDGIVGTQAGVFNGSSSKWVAGAHLFGANATASDVSVSGWFQVSSNSQYLIADGYLGTGGKYFAVNTSGGKLVAGTGDASGGNNIGITSSTSVTDGEWHHFAFTKSVSSGTATGKLYVDGNFEGSDTTTSTGAFANETAFGHRVDANGYYSCTLDQIRIFNRVLTDAEVQELAGGYGLDTSGVGNHFNPANLQATQVVLDSPTNNFATLNPLYTGSASATFSEGNLKNVTPSSGYGTAIATMVPQSGKYYAEFIGANILGIRDVTLSAANTTSLTAGSTKCIGYFTDGRVFTNGSTVLTTVDSFSTTDVVGITIDYDNSEVKWYVNNTLKVTRSSLDLTNVTFAVGDFGNTVTSTILCNFGQDSANVSSANSDENGIGTFEYAPPSGFLCLASGSLPDPAIDPAQDEEPADYFNTVLYSGNNGSQSVTGVGHQPDLVWLKRRNDVNGHKLYDSIRGAGINFNISDSVEATSANGYFTSFDSDGFSLAGGDNAHNTSGGTYVAWNWLAGGSAVTNNEGSVTSSVSANTKAGFSIVTHDNGSGTRTVGHGLNSAPEIIFEKKRDSTGDWLVQTTVIDGSNDYLRLNTNAAKANGAGASPTSTVFTPNVGGGADCLAYCFHSVEGFSKIGTYESNNSTDGPFVFTGFKPAWILMKDADRSSMAWVMFDNKRGPLNPNDESLTPAGSSAEPYDSNSDIDFLSNGFKLRGGSSSWNNYLTETYIYIAFAAQVSKYSNAE